MRIDDNSREHFRDVVEFHAGRYVVEGYMRRSSTCLMVGRTRGKRTLLKLFYFLSVAG
jgi:hypothetical protein